MGQPEGKACGTIPPCKVPRGVQAFTYFVYTYFCSPFEVLEKGCHHLQSLKKG